MAKKYVSEFVKRQQALQARLKIKRYYWFSHDPKGRGLTYIKAKHGEHLHAIEVK